MSIESILTAIVTFLGAFLGSGVLQVLLEWVRAAHSEREGSMVSHIREQVERLYGPLYYLVSQNLAISGVTKMAHDIAFENLGERISIDEMHQTVRKSQAYRMLIHENNQEIKRLIREHYWLVDQCDEHEFNEFILAVTRTEQEYAVPERETYPTIVAMKMPSVPGLATSFVEAVTNSYRKKVEALSNSRRPLISFGKGPPISPSRPDSGSIALTVNSPNSESSMRTVPTDSR